MERVKERKVRECELRSSSLVSGRTKNTIASSSARTETAESTMTVPYNDDDDSDI